ncbi:MAG: NDP-sugar synthase [Verrucomicrobiae bacterium]|nr:NDP-sugar synthase [Verrucomicrobiae bacterium]
MGKKIRQAFVLGAGLGTRLRPLTETVPKPMIPLWNRPLLTWAFDHLIADAGTEAFMVNTHHCPEVYDDIFPDRRWRGASLDFRHEPTLLVTAGGIANVADWLPSGDESFFVYNGDILTDLPLAPAIEAHENSGALVTMVLRSEGAALQVAWDEQSGRVADIRQATGRGGDLPRFQFTGIYLVRPAFLEWLTPGKIESVILPFLEVIRQTDGIGGVVIDEGEWSDLGNRETYLDASVALARRTAFPRYGREDDASRIHPSAQIASTAIVDEATSVGEGAVIESGAEVRESILWPGCRVGVGSRLSRCVVRSGRFATGEVEGVDF